MSEQASQLNNGFYGLLLLLMFSLVPLQAVAKILPEERADIMYHEYDGDGIKISGPSVLVRKNFMDKVSVSANYYIDNVTSASIDVRSYGSPYTEKRTEQSLGVDFLNEKSILSFSYTNSSENDYEADTYFFGISQDFFGDLTTLSIGFGIGDDVISKTGDESFEKNLDRQNYRISVSQILTKKLIMGVNIETITEEGYLQNPYRQSSILDQTNDATAGRPESWTEEQYPETRTSDAISISLKYYLPYRAALHGEFRYYSDSWKIQGRNLEVGYTHPLEEYPVTLEFRYRYYTQDKAEFFYDFIDARDGSDIPDFHGRDKELSTYSTATYGVGAKWVFLPGGWRFIDKASVSFYYDYIDLVYDDFRDAPKSIDGDFAAGSEPFLEFDAGVIRFFFTAVY
ncbi:MAG: DUF3570 domain-containing protein [Ketobacteraceae bacterium]|nr:DUF3570 domain-containing protein [Ketobacteraceae bacterium]